MSYRKHIHVHAKPGQYVHVHRQKSSSAGKGLGFLLLIGLVIVLLPYILMAAAFLFVCWLIAKYPKETAAVLKFVFLAAFFLVAGTAKILFDVGKWLFQAGATAFRKYRNPAPAAAPRATVQTLTIDSVQSASPAEAIPAIVYKPHPGWKLKNQGRQ